MFTADEVTLTGVGPDIPAGNLIAGDNRVQVTEVSPKVYAISGFNWVSGYEGAYTLTVFGAGIHDVSGNAFSNNVYKSGHGHYAPGCAHRRDDHSHPFAAARGMATGLRGNCSRLRAVAGSGPPRVDVRRFHKNRTGRCPRYRRDLQPAVGAAGGRPRPAVHGHRCRRQPLARGTVRVSGQPPDAGNQQPGAHRPETGPVSFEDIVFSKQIDLATFNYRALTLTEGNDPTNLISSSSGITVTAVVGRFGEYHINGLTAAYGPTRQWHRHLHLDRRCDHAAGPGWHHRRRSGTVTWTAQPAVMTTPTSYVYPLPTITNSTQFTVQWAGQDYQGGGGIATYDVHVQDDGGPFTLWQSNTAATSAVFTGLPGQSYGFYSMATDQGGNQEVKTAVAEARTLVQIATTTSVGPSGAFYGRRSR